MKTMSEKVTVPQLLASKSRRRRIVMVTAYDATFARLLDQPGVDVLLVGDSLGMVIQGHANTIPVSVDDIIYHCRAVSRGITRAHLCADMPFLANKVSVDRSLECAARIVQEGRAESVKLEGGEEAAEAINRIVRAGIPVVGHVGMTPQSVHAFGGFRTQGKEDSERRKIRKDALAVAEAGAFCLVLEGIPMELAADITKSVAIPTVGIGAGPHCDGQVLVSYDLLGLSEDFSPKFLKKYADLATSVKEAIAAYGADVHSGTFPGPEHSTSLRPGTAERRRKK